MNAHPALVAYLDALPGTVLSPGFRERISARERRREYPFARQNIYRVLFAVAPVLRRGWLATAAARPLDPADPALGTSLRCFRYLHAALLDPGPDEAAAAALEPLAARALRALTRPACFCPPGTPREEDAPVPVDTALRLAATLRQYADVRWLGQHDQGFAGLPPCRLDDGDLACTRCFGRLPPALGFPGLEVTVTYRPPAGTQVTFDPFRGELTQPPPRESAVRASVSSPGTGALAEPTVKQLLARAVTALREAPAAQPEEKARSELAVAGMFTRELCDAAAARGIDPAPWRAQAAARLPHAAPPTACLTEAYLDRLELSRAAWKVMLCGGS